MRTVKSFLILTLLLLVACDRSTDVKVVSSNPGAAQGPPQIYTVNYPLYWAAQQLVGEGGDVHFPAPTHIDPAFWQPDAKAIAAFQQADLILLNGASYARWVSRVSLPVNRLVDTSRAFATQLIPLDGGPVHSHGPQGDHSHGEKAFTLWLDLGFYVQQVQATAAAIARKFPQLASNIAAREKELVEQFVAMDGALKRLGREFDGAPVLYSHPVYQYFDRRYQFKGRALHWEPDQLPSPEDWSELRALLVQYRAAIMLWEAEPLPETRAGLRELGVESVVFRPMGNRPDEGDFLSGMSANIERLRAYRSRVAGDH
jgi:zinc transport system substrate-binding protein